MITTPEDAAFLQAFESCALPADDWTHTAHVRMAWLCLSAGDSFTGALNRIRNGIKRYNREVLNKLPEYHETVTVAFARLIASRMQADEDWQHFMLGNDDLFARTPPALATYYSSRLLMSDAARRHFVAPDLKPLPEPRGP